MWLRSVGAFNGEHYIRELLLWDVPTQLHSGALGPALQPHLYHLEWALLGHDGPFQQHDGILCLDDLGWAGRSKLASCTSLEPFSSPLRDLSSSSASGQLPYIMEETFPKWKLQAFRGLNSETCSAALGLPSVGQTKSWGSPRFKRGDRLPHLMRRMP